MSSPDPSGSARPLRLGGLALLGVAGIALVLGVITVVGNGSGQAQNGGQQQATTSPPPTTLTIPVPTGTTTTTPPGTETTTEVTTTTTPGATTTPGTTTTVPPGGEPNARSVPVRVYNNSTISGLANTAADDFRAAGWNVVEVGNYSESQGIIPTSTVYYRPGTEERAAAYELGASFNLRVKPRFEGIADAHPGLIVIVTQDYEGDPGKK